MTLQRNSVFSVWFMQYFISLFSCLLLQKLHGVSYFGCLKSLFSQLILENYARLHLLAYYRNLFRKALLQNYFRSQKDGHKEGNRVTEFIKFCVTMTFAFHYSNFLIEGKTFDRLEWNSKQISIAKYGNGQG